jgi:hypothetical protein
MTLAANNTQTGPSEYLKFKPTDVLVRGWRRPYLL